MAKSKSEQKRRDVVEAPTQAFSLENAGASEVRLIEYVIQGGKVVEQGEPEYITKPAAAVWIKKKLLDILSRN